MVRNLAVFLILSFLFSHLLAGTTGKITGLAKDQSNAEPLAGVNIDIDGVDISNPIGVRPPGYLKGNGDNSYTTDLPEASINEVQVITGGNRKSDQ